MLRMTAFEGVLTAIIGSGLGTALITTTLVPFSLNRSGSPFPSGPLWMYLAVVCTAAAVTLLATLAPTWLRLRGRPLDDVVVG
jgi:putative ABC transport system permease protein